MSTDTNKTTDANPGTADTPAGSTKAGDAAAANPAPVKAAEEKLEVRQQSYIDPKTGEKKTVKVKILRGGRQRKQPNA